MKLNTRVIVIIFIFQNVIAVVNLLKNVEELINEKKELYNQINAAIEDSLKTLKKSNDSESITGLNYMKELKKHIIEINKTDNDSDIGIDTDSKSYLENRRKFSFKDLKNPKKDHRDPFNFEAILKPKKTSEVQWKQLLENRIKVQMKLDDWILQRQKERDRLNEYRLQKKRLMMSGQYEMCPRFGYGAAGKNFIDDKIESKKNKNSKVKYPCCRKCCKKSYMGCL